MNFEGVRVNRIDFKNFDRELPPHHVVANILFIDKSHEGLFPMAYQLLHDLDFHDNHLGDLESTLDRLDNSSFLVLGDVETINKNEKIVSLTGGNSVRYTYLILISNRTQHHLHPSERFEEFVAALRTLIHAIRTKLSITPNEYIAHQPSELDLAMNLKQGLSDKQEQSSVPKNMRRVFYTQMLNDSSISYAVSHKATGRRLYELQI